jgi:hypothetical protein
MKTIMFMAGMLLCGMAIMLDMVSAPRYGTILLASGVCAAGAMIIFGFAFRRFKGVGKFSCIVAILFLTFVLVDVFRRSFS